MSLLFFRFKKKSLITVLTICPDELKEILSQIRFKKLFQCIVKAEQSIPINEINLVGHTNSVSCVIVLKKTEIASGSWDCTIKIWDLPSGKYIKFLIVIME